jgi:tetratricopeptide (TPR) repeat protein/predicted Ser/Thr protein kinase
MSRVRGGDEARIARLTPRSGARPRFSSAGDAALRIPSFQPDLGRFVKFQEIVPSEPPLTGPSERLGRVLRERYRIERELGAGGMAVVYLATDLQQNRTVALKVLRPELASMIGPERFLREIDIASKLNHPNILPLFDAGEADGLPYFVMPYIEGESLRDRLAREEQLSVADALQIIREVADGLSYAHAHGIIHRDIKPENIMLSSGHALVADFGIARAVSDAGGTNKLTGTGIAIGTVPYMSPEQATGSAKVDARSDLYSLACVLYEMLVGGPPFPASTPQGVLARHLVDPVPSIRTVRSTVPVQVEEAILAALAKSKADRFPSVAAFVEALDGKLPSPSQPYQAAQAARVRRRWPLVLAGSTALALLITAAWVVLSAPTLDPKRVLVGRFEDWTGDRALNGLAAQAATEIVSGLASIGIVQPMDAASVTAEGARAHDYPSLRPLARRVGAGSVVSGSISRRADSLEFQIKLTDVATGDLLRPVRSVVQLAAEPTAAVALVAQRVMAGYAAHFDPRFHNYATISQPATYDAYREFQTGFRTSWEGEGNVALDHFRRAIALDSAFMAPRIYVAVTDGCRATDSIAAAFRAAGSHLLPSDQARIDFEAAECRQDLRGRYAAAQQLFRDAPELDENVFLVAQAAFYLNKPREALTCVERLGRARDPAVYFRLWCVNIMTHAYHQLGQYREALQFIDRTRAELSDDPLLERNQMRHWAALGDLKRVNALIDQRLGKSSQVLLAGGDMLAIGEELRGHGYIAAGRALCERAIGWYGTRPSSEQATFDSRATVAKALYCAERWDRARVAYQRLASEDSSETPRGMDFRTRLGALAARRGDSAEVARIDRWFAARDSLPRASYGRAVLAGFRGDRVRALALFQFAWERREPGFGEAHTDPLLEPLRDYPPFLALLYAAR